MQNAECRIETTIRGEIGSQGRGAYAAAFILHSAFCISYSIVARNRLDRGDHLLVGDLFRGAGKAGVAAVHQDGPVALRVAAQRVDQLPPLRVVEGTEVHGKLSFRCNGTRQTPAARSESP